MKRTLWAGAQGTLTSVRALAILWGLCGSGESIDNIFWGAFAAQGTFAALCRTSRASRLPAGS
eukprot:1161392-Pelagomonas_calceolata.AAC.6